MNEAIDLAIEKYENIYNAVSSALDAVQKVIHLNIPPDQDGFDGAINAHTILTEISEEVAKRRVDFQHALGALKG